MKSCTTCGMPFVGAHANDIGMEIAEGPVCTFDCQNGALKSAEEIFEGGVQFFVGAVTNGDREQAARLTRKNMQSLAYWQAHPFTLLDGAMASDEELQSAMMKL